MTEAFRWCRYCLKRKPTEGFTKVLSKAGKLVTYRCGTCTAGKLLSKQARDKFGEASRIERQTDNKRNREDSIVASKKRKALIDGME